MIKCAIHQPNFFPWKPYFNKIKQVDIFVFLDNVAYPKSGNSMGSWVNRVKLDMHGQDIWFSCPVVRESGTQIIKDVRIKENTPWIEERLNTIRHAYTKSKNFSIVYPLLQELFSESHSCLATWNEYCIKKICEHLHLKTKFIRQSELNTVHASTHLLVEICKKVGADVYLSGQGAVAYQEEPIFRENKITLQYQDFAQSNSQTLSPFSIIHHLMNCNPEDWSML